MTIKFQLSKSDFLTFHLYVASKTKNIRKKQLSIYVKITLIWAAMAIVLTISNVYIDSIAFLFGGIVFIFGYPHLSNFNVKRSLKNYIDKHYQHQIESDIHVEFTPEHIITTHSFTQTKVLKTAVHEIVSIPTLIIFQLKNGQGMVIPKSIFQTHELTETYFHDLAEELNINYKEELKWKWI